MVQDMPQLPPAFERPAELQYPFGGFVFSGSVASLAKLKAAGEAAGLRLKAFDVPGQPSSLMISGDDTFGKFDLIMGLWKKASDGAFGRVVGGLISEPPASR